MRMDVKSAARVVSRVIYLVVFTEGAIVDSHWELCLGPCVYTYQSVDSASSRRLEG